MIGQNHKQDQTTKAKVKHPKLKNNTRRRLHWILPTLTLLIIITVVIIQDRQTSDKSRSADSVSSLRSIGPQSAPVTITEYADFGCVSCQAWHQFGIRKEVISAYGNQVRFVWRDFPMTTTNSPIAAEAGFCAHDQDRFWDYHDILFENAPPLAMENLKAYAERIDLDIGMFNQCLESRKYQQAVENELAAAKELRLRGVPSFIINGRRLIGPPSFEQLAATIEEILASQE